MPHELRQQRQRKIAIRKQNRDQTKMIPKPWTKATSPTTFFDTSALQFPLLTKCNFWRRRKNETVLAFGRYGKHGGYVRVQ